MKVFWIRVFHKIILIGRNWVNKIDSEYMKLSICCDRDVEFLEGARIINLQKKDAIRIKKGSVIRGELHTYGHGGEICIGEDCYIGPHSYIWSGNKIELGNRVMLSCDCKIFDNDTHPLDPEERFEQSQAILHGGGHPKDIELHDKPIIIEDDVLICANVTIFGGCHIGRGSVIGCNSLVNKDIPAGVLAYGNPVKIVKRICI